MILELKAKHFKGTDYFDCSSCSIAKAYSDLTGNSCSEDWNELIDENKKVKFNHDGYDFEMFKIDRLKAQSQNFDETVIRTIELTEQ